MVGPALRGTSLGRAPFWVPCQFARQQTHDGLRPPYVFFFFFFFFFFFIEPQRSTTLRSLSLAICFTAVAMVTAVLPGLVHPKISHTVAHTCGCRVPPVPGVGVVDSTWEVDLWSMVCRRLHGVDSVLLAWGVNRI